MYEKVLKAEVNSIAEKLRRSKVVVKIVEAEEAVLAVSAFLKVKISATTKAAQLISASASPDAEGPRLEFKGSRLAFIGLFASPVLVILLAVLSLVLVANIYLAIILIAISLATSFLLTVDPFSPDFIKRLLEKDEELREGVATVLKFVKEALRANIAHDLDVVVTLLDKTYLAKVRRIKNGLSITLSPTSPW